MSSFPTLHGDSANGKTKVWSIQVINENGCGIIKTIRGFLGGKMQINEKVISEGKNVGKKNETTPVQQAILESQSLWTKMKENGYYLQQEQQQQQQQQQQQPSKPPGRSVFLTISKQQ